MKNFLRALRCAWPYRVRLGVSVVCAILAAIFWGLNFTAIYPVLKVIGFVVLAVAIKGFFEFWQETLVGSVVNLSLFDLRNRFFRKAVHLDVQTFSGEGSHELMARVTNDMELLGGGLKTLFGRVVAE